VRAEREIRERLKAITNLKPIYITRHENGLLVGEYWICPICGERGGEEMYDHCELCPKVEEEVRVLKWVLGEEQDE
jgi:rubrerythrin